MAYAVRGPSRGEFAYFVLIAFIAVVIIFGVASMGLWGATGLATQSGAEQPGTVLQNMVIAGVVAGAIAIVLHRQNLLT